MCAPSDTTQASGARWPSLRHHARGLSLIEVVAALVVLGVVMVGFLSLFGTAMRHRLDPQIQHQALHVAQAYLEEILAQPYAAAVVGPCPAAASARPGFAHPCDYHLLSANGCTATSASCPTLGDCPCDRNGQPIDGLPGFAVAAHVSPQTVSGAPGLRVRVGVSHAVLPGDGVRLEAFRTVD